MKRYQDLIEYHLARNNMEVYDMLNAKYFIVRGQGNNPELRINPKALGNAWFVDSARIVGNPDEEIMALDDFDPAKEAIVDTVFAAELQGLPHTIDSAATIKFISYKANHLVYQSKSSQKQLAVFSEIYYPKGWNAYVDGELHPHFRVNYVLRAMVVPEGEHQIEFKFEPKSYYTGNKIALASSTILVLLLASVFYLEIKKYLQSLNQGEETAKK